MSRGSGDHEAPPAVRAPAELRPHRSLLPPLRHALGGAVSHWPLALALYLPSLLIALATALPFFLGMVALSALGPWVDLIARGSYLEAGIEMGAGLRPAGVSPGGLPPRLNAALAGVSLAVLLVFPGLLLQWLAYTLLSGGVLARLVGVQSASLWRLCWEWFWPMLRLGMLGFLLLVFLGGLGTTLLALAPETGALPLASLALLAWLASVNGLLELARAELVLRGGRSARAALARALRDLARPSSPLRALLAWLVLAALGAALWALGAAAQALVPAPHLAGILVFSQALALLGAWLKLLRLAVAVELARVSAP